MQAAALHRSLTGMYLALGLVVLCNFFLWWGVRHEQARWSDAPLAPSRGVAVMQGVGDAQLAYRYFGLFLQNMGDTGGKTVPLDQYDYNRLTDWFYLETSLDKRSNFMPFLAAYYFGGVQDNAADKLRPLIRFLIYAGSIEGKEKWRWLGQAAFLARFRLNDLDWALEIAKKLRTANNGNLPLWALQMNALILEQKGEKQAAYAMMLDILKSSADKLHPNEVNFMIEYMCRELLDAAQAAENPLCQKK